MKKSLLTLAFVLCSCMSVFSQATSLTVDCQNPGWLSSKIGYGDQQTVKNLKITGYINGTDIQFIQELKTTQKLEVLDLSDVSIVAGGSSDLNTKANWFRFDYLKGNRKLKKIITPKTAETQVVNTTIADSVIFCGIETSVSMYIAPSSNSTRTPEPICHYVQFSESTNTLYLHSGSYYVYTSADGTTYYTGTLVFPSSINFIKNLRMAQGTIISYIMNPSNVQTGEYVEIKSGTIYVPIGTKELYQKSVFSKMTIIEMAPPTDILIETQQIKLYKGDKQVINTTLIPQNSFFNELIWETSDETIATVSQSGEVTGVNAGTTVLTVRSAKDPEVNASCTITVYEHTTGLFISHTEKTLVIGDSFSLSAHTIPEGETDNEIIWNSSDDNIAVVNEEGQITAINIGNCVIKATSVDGSFTATCEVRVVPPVPVQGITLNNSTLQFEYIGETAYLEATILPEDAANKNIRWTSSNESVCVVSNGMIVTVGMGTSVVIATTEDGGFMAVCIVTVTSATGISSVGQNDGMMFQIYDINGLKQKQLQKGINIIQFKDGTKRKVFIK